MNNEQEKGVPGGCLGYFFGGDSHWNMKSAIGF